MTETTAPPPPTRSRLSRALWALPGPLVLLALCAGVTVLHVAVLREALDGAWSVPIDDTYIHFQYARGIAQGHPFAYHAQDGYSTGCTSPLYVTLLAVPLLLGVEGLGLVPVTLVLGGVWLLLSGLLLVRLGRLLALPGAGELAAALWCTWGFAWYCLFCGMETGLWITLLLATLCALVSWTRRPEGDLRPGWPLLLFAALLPVTRPEGLALLAALLAVVAARTFLAVPWRDALRLAPRWLPALVPAVAYYGANRALTGTFSTAGMVSKSLLHAPYMTASERVARFAEQLAEVARHFLHGQDPLFLVSVVTVPGLAALLAAGLHEPARRRAGPHLLIALWTVLCLLFASAHYIRIARWERYYLPLFLLCLLGAGVAAVWAARAVRRPHLVAGLAAVLVLFQADSTVRWVKAYAHDVKAIYNKQASAARAVRALPPTARVLVCDAGAIPYISGRWTFDIVGLTTPLGYNWFRNGVGSRFELFERLPASRRPDHIAAYGFCLWPGAHGVVQSMHHDMMVAGVAESQAGTGERPALPLDPDLAVVDRVDVADLHSEAAHDYRRGRTGDIRENVLRRARYRGAGEIIADGGRLIKLGERMTVSAVAGKDLWVVARHTVGLDVTLHVELGGVRRAVKLTKVDPDDWNETKIKFPGKVVSKKNTLVVRSQGKTPYHAYHYFVMQRGADSAHTNGKQKRPRDGGVRDDGPHAFDRP